MDKDSKIAKASEDATPAFEADESMKEASNGEAASSEVKKDQSEAADVPISPSDIPIHSALKDCERFCYDHVNQKLISTVNKKLTGIEAEVQKDPRNEYKVEQDPIMFIQYDE